jgi:DegV family protein with EDD domain
LYKYAVVTDSSSDIPKRYIEKLGIKVVPLYIHYNNNEYRDGIDISSSEIYKLQKEEKAIFTSSAPSPHDFLKVYKELLEDYEKIISIHISSKLSAVIKSANIAKDFLNEEDRIEVYDSCLGSMGTGFLAIATAKAIMQDYGMEKIRHFIDFLKQNMRLFGTINTLEYLKRSGRAPELANIVTAITKIKPILGIHDGIVQMIGISVTRRRSLFEITQRALKECIGERWVLVSIIHSLSLSESKMVMHNLQQKLNMVESIITECTPVVGAHTGPGLIGIIICKLDYDLAKLFL